MEKAVRITEKPYTPKREILCMLQRNHVIFTDCREILQLSFSIDIADKASSEMDSIHCIALLLYEEISFVDSDSTCSRKYIYDKGAFINHNLPKKIISTSLYFLYLRQTLRLYRNNHYLLFMDFSMEYGFTPIGYIKQLQHALLQYVAGSIDGIDFFTIYSLCISWHNCIWIAGPV